MRDIATPRRVLFVESGPGYGGSAFSLFRLIKSLDYSRYETHVVVSHSADAFEQIRGLHVPVKTLPLFLPFWRRTRDDRGVWARARNYSSAYGNLGADTLRNGIWLARYIRRNQIHLVHLNNGLYENLSAAFAARLNGIPCVSHVRGTVPIPRLETYIPRWVSAVITLNHAVFRDYVRAFGSDKVHLICNGVDLDAFQKLDRQKIRQEFNLRPDIFAVGTFARLVEGKGIPEFIATASRVSKEYQQSRFFIVGNAPSKDTPFEMKTRKLAEELGLDAQQLVFTGWRNDRIDVMAAMDAVLQISTTFPEGMSLAPLEAMASAKPVIVTTLPGYEFCVADGKTGFVVAPGDIQDLTQKVLLLARDRDRAKSMGQEGYRKAVAEFDIRLTARRVQDIYDRVLSGN